MAKAREILESWLGTFFVTLLSLIGLMLTIMASMEATFEVALALMVGLGAIWFWQNCRHLLWMWRAVAQNEHPAAVSAALRQRPLPLMVRPLVAAWWLIYFIMGVAFILIMEQQVLQEAETGGIPSLVIAASLAFIYAYVANAYMLMAVATLISSPRIIRRVWRWRVVIDLSLVAVSLLLPPELFLP